MGDTLYLHVTDGPVDRDHRVRVHELLATHAPDFEAVERDAFVDGSTPAGSAAGSSQLTFRMDDSLEEWVALDVPGCSSYEDRFALARLVADLVTAGAFDWGVWRGTAPSGPPTPRDVGELVAIGGAALSRIGPDRVATAPAFAKFERETAVSLLVAIHGDDDALEAVETYLSNPLTEDVDPGDPIALETVPSVGDEALDLLEAVGDWHRTTGFLYGYQPTRPGTRLEGLLADDRPTVRAEAAWAFGEVTSKDLARRHPEDFAADSTLRLLAETAADDPVAAVRAEVLESTTKILQLRTDAEFTVDLFERARSLALTDPSPRVRGAAVETLGWLKCGHVSPERVLDPLREVYRTDDDPEPRGQALREIGLIDEDAAIVLEGLGSDHPEIRSRAATLLSTQVATAGTGMGSPEFLDRLRANADAVRRATTAADDEVRAAAINALGLLESGAAETDVLVDLLETADEADTRAAAADTLGLIGDASPETLAALAAAIDDPSASVRRGAIRSLGDLWDESAADLRTDAVPSLVEQLSADDGSVRDAAAKTLGTIGDERAVEPLLDAVDDGRLGSWEGLEPLGDIGPTAADRLCERLREYNRGDRDDENVTGLAKGLARTNDPRAVGILVETYVEAEDEETGDESETTDDVAADAEDDRLSEFDRRTVGRALGATGDERALEPLLEGLRDGTPGAVEGLGELGSVAVGPLLDCFERTSGDRQYRAARALGRTGSPRALRPLLESLAAADPALRAAICDALGHTDDERLVPVLRQLSTVDPDEVVRENANDALRTLCQSVRKQAFEARGVER